ncbi:MAG: hypothetical protein COZ06_17015 [Armatimonadetes bacterium CG_4_10_14_3_um_filter_66_18]|nr:hypothetical protein [Armatimonadota bacterium]OIP01292.1 MAG: hypothetical protein AUJ96_17530 [Armatimonadetes bacterium CG2_30_66_41]PIU93039.1 MAG: hypothetical protein COS65_14780 [Armatimonadetes bacterium CG06_land_8_20_14_3_00_66_21]PIW20172.1 MAG: hypothetical protein COW34_02465 [Armatimonadetes bacterium CG17_big_fil_post_rev_8_21_14_2_50_66_6]PIX48900.1 MAG: hypothetical protein COZ57_04595 [Armatimonadetes bacterium CG_4_8_14_3_um_filter_66_20]PIY48221.1 MAG: hypothetical prote
MVVTGVVEGNVVRLHEDGAISDGTLVRVVPEEAVGSDESESPLTLGEWLRRAREVRSRLPMTSDSVEILRELREERANRC